MGEPCRCAVCRGEADGDSLRRNRNKGPRNSDGTWVEGVARGPYKPHPFPIGARFGELTVIRYEHHITPKGKPWGYRPVVRCSCGAEFASHNTNLRKGRTTRCLKCGRITGATKRYWKYRDAMPDNEHRRRLCNRLSAAIARCHNPNNRQYKNYGERGISVHDEWRKDKGSFLRYVQTLEGWDDPSLEMDRADTNGNYEPDNIRFVTRKVNSNNRRTVVELQRENTRLRHLLRRAKAAILRCKQERAAYRS